MPTSTLSVTSQPPDPTVLDEEYRRIREQTERLCAPLSPEDCQAQSMPDASPAKWHLAHTTWFFETFVLERWQEDFAAFHSAYRVLFNSYYNAVGRQHARPERGLLTRPSLDEVMRYRSRVDEQVRRLLAARDDGELRRVVEVGLHHEQQHQELILTDVKHLLSRNPMRPSYREPVAALSVDAAPLEWVAYAGGVVEIGHDGRGFAFDNEGPRHEVVLRPFAIASRPVTVGELLEFIEDDGYQRPELWLSDGWATVRERGWTAPLYWKRENGTPRLFTLRGERELRLEEPVCHLSYYEADAFARWAGARLPTEAEWEVAARNRPRDGNFVESERFHPAPVAATSVPAQIYGDVWEWTRSPYSPYPGYAPPPGALGEYNGKFMCNQLVLRGGSCATPAAHIRATYRNFFPPDARWQLSGLRLARDA